MVEVLLASAVEILEAEGPEALSVRRIAAAAGVAPMGVYNHFDSKNGIIEALFIQGFERLREALTNIADIADPYEALREAGRRYRALAQAHPMVYQLMFLRTLPGYEPSDSCSRGRGPGLRELWWPPSAGHGGRRHRRRAPDRDSATHLVIDPRMGLARTARHRHGRRPGLRIRPGLFNHAPRTPATRVLTGIWPVQVPVAGHRRKPADPVSSSNAPRDHPEPADRPLTTFGVPIEQLDREGCGLGHRPGSTIRSRGRRSPGWPLARTRYRWAQRRDPASEIERSRDPRVGFRSAMPARSTTIRSGQRCPIRHCAPKSPDRWRRPPTRPTPVPLRGGANGRPPIGSSASGPVCGR